MIANSERIYVKDTCILFDLIDLNLADEFFHLGYMVLTTREVIAEIIDAEHFEIVSSFINDQRLIVDTTDEFGIVQALCDQYPGLSYADCSILYLAKMKDAVLLSADGSLRRIAESDGLCVRGVLWIVRELFESGIITGAYAIEKLEMYKTVNSRSPKIEIDAMIKSLL